CTATSLVTRQHSGIAKCHATLLRAQDFLRQHARIEKTEVDALAGKRMHHMCRVANQCQMMANVFAGMHGVDRESATAPGQLATTEHVFAGMRQCRRKGSVVE